MKYTLASTAAASTKTSLLVVPLFQKEKQIKQFLTSLPPTLRLLAQRAMERQAFVGARNTATRLQTHGHIAPEEILFMGMGEEKTWTLEMTRCMAAQVVKKYAMHDCAFLLPDTSFPIVDITKATLIGASLASYQYDIYHDEKRKKREEKGVKEITIISSEKRVEKMWKDLITEVSATIDAVSLARDLVNEPASIATPTHLAQHAKKIAELHPALSVRVLNREQAKKAGLHAFLAVAAGAEEEPQFIHLSYTPRSAKKHIALVGKGITFDSGGLQIKPDGAMRTMKCDMSGAAAVLGVFSLLPILKLPLRVDGYIAATENMPGRFAYKPGDVVRAKNGMTIEIGHTDAEGRVTLADALSVAAETYPDALIDLATLTGACMVGLGDVYAGVMGNDDKLLAKLKQASAETGELLWELPFEDTYEPLIKSEIADVRNDASVRYGGAITAGLFLKKFVGETPWAHLDIAGPAYAERDFSPYIPHGGTGFGVRLLLSYLQALV